MKIPWQAWTTATVVSWGVWGFLNGIALRDNKWQQLIVWSAPMALLAAGAMFVAMTRESKFTLSSLFWGSGIQILAIVGVVCFYQALKVKETAIVVPVSAAYPAVTVLIAVFFGREQIVARHYVGIALVIAGTLVISLGKPEAVPEPPPEAAPAVVVEAAAADSRPAPGSAASDDGLPGGRRPPPGGDGRPGGP